MQPDHLKTNYSTEASVGTHLAIFFLFYIFFLITEIVGENYLYYACMYICWKLLSNRNFKGPYLKAEVVEEIMGWLG